MAEFPQLQNPVESLTSIEEVIITAWRGLNLEWDDQQVHKCYGQVSFRNTVCSSSPIRMRAIISPHQD